MHLDFTISLGNIVTVLVVFGGIIRIERMLRYFLIEHEILIEWYCKVHDIDRKSLPTRSRLG